MAKEILDQLFDSPVKVRVLKLFLRNAEEAFSVDDVATRIKSTTKEAQAELDSLSNIGLLASRKMSKKGKIKKSGLYYFANSSFEFYQELRTLVLKSSPTSKEKILNNMKKLGRMKMVVLAGVFLNNDNSRVDLFLVADNFNEKKLQHFLKEMEAEIGKDISYAFMNTDEFNYRYGMFDRFILDVLERPHEKLINKLNIE